MVVSLAEERASEASLSRRSAGMRSWPWIGELLLEPEEGASFFSGIPPMRKSNGSNGAVAGAWTDDTGLAVGAADEAVPNKKSSAVEGAVAGPLKAGVGAGDDHKSVRSKRLSCFLTGAGTRIDPVEGEVPWGCDRVSAGTGSDVTGGFAGANFEDFSEGLLVVVFFRPASRDTGTAPPPNNALASCSFSERAAGGLVDTDEVRGLDSRLGAEAVTGTEAAYEGVE